MDHFDLMPFRPRYSKKVQFVLFLWRWSFEITAAVLLVVAVVQLHDHGLPVVPDSWPLSEGMPYWGAVGVLVITFASPFAVPVTRRWLLAGFWASVTRHRLRVFFVECRVYNRSGKLPWILSVRPTAVGERVWIWLMPGLAPADLANATDYITTACWARDTRVERHRSIGSLVKVDVVRRDPLTARLIPSVLVPAQVKRRLVPRTSGPLDVEQKPFDPARIQWGSRSKTTDSTAAGKATSTRPTNASPIPGVPTQKQPPTDTPAGEPPQDPPVIGRGGEDVSDYL